VIFVEENGEGQGVRLRKKATALAPRPWITAGRFVV